MGGSVGARTSPCIAAVSSARSRRTRLPASRRRGPSVRLLSARARCGQPAAVGCMPCQPRCEEAEGTAGKARKAVCWSAAFPSELDGRLSSPRQLLSFLCPDIRSKQSNCRASACAVFDIALMLCVTSGSHLSVLLDYSRWSARCLM